MKKLISMLLVLMLVCSLLPVSAMAIKLPAGALDNLPAPEQVPSRPTLEKQEDKHKEDLSQKLDVSKIEKKKEAPVYYHPTGEHEYGYASNATYHWLQCPCGCQINKEPHVAPEDAVNDYCICGYHFSSNAELVTLWINGCPPIKNFNKDTTEYKLNAYTYKDVKEIKVSTRTFDSEATVELPEDLSLKEGENKIEIKVISENKKVTKIYTVIINKEAQK